MTKDEKRYLSLVSDLGCIACRKKGFIGTPAEIHHPRSGTGKGQRASHYDAIPLCPAHHRGTVHPFVPSIHLDKVEFIYRFGAEAELLEEVRRLME